MLAVLALALLVVRAGDTVAGAVSPRLIIGMNGDANDTMAGRVGVTHVRQNLDWAQVQPRPGQWRWAPADFRVRAAAERGVTLLPVLLGGARWAGGWNVLPADPRAYARWVGRVAARYGPGGRFWRENPSLPYRPVQAIELWNEPYLDFFSRGGVDPARYARLVRAATIAGRKANPAVKYLLQADWTPGEPRKSFIDAMYAAVPDLTDHFDAVAVHPYSVARAPDQPDDPWGFARLHEVRARMVAHGAAAKPLWITEVGWSTCPAGRRTGCVTEREQAAYLRRVHELVVAQHPAVRRLYYYTGRDRRSRAADREGWFGVLRSDETAKPGYFVLREIARTASG